MNLGDRVRVRQGTFHAHPHWWGAAGTVVKITATWVGYLMVEIQVDNIPGQKIAMAAAGYEPELNGLDVILELL